MELQKNFTIVKKGYNVEEVDGAIDDLIAKNQYLAKENAELQKKLDTSRRLIRRFTGMENDLRKNIADSKRAAASMITDTEARSNVLLDTTREECGKIISELDTQIAERMDIVDNMKAEVATFKEQLFDLYSNHIDMIEQLTAKAENFAYIPDYSGISDAVETFEEAEPDVAIPEFEEYPQESIFSEIEEEKPGTFVIEETQEDTEPAEEVEYRVENEDAFAPEEDDEIEYQVADETLLPEEKEEDEPFKETFFSDVADEYEAEDELVQLDEIEELPEEYDEVGEIAEEGDFEEQELFEEAEEYTEEVEDPADVNAEPDADEKLFVTLGDLTSESEPNESESEMNDEDYFNFLKNFVNEEESDSEQG